MVVLFFVFLGAVGGVVVRGFFQCIIVLFFAPVGYGCCSAEAAKLPASLSGKPQHNQSRTGLETGPAPPLTREQSGCLAGRKRE